MREIRLSILEGHASRQSDALTEPKALAKKDTAALGLHTEGKAPCQMAHAFFFYGHIEASSWTLPLLHAKHCLLYAEN